MYDSGDITKNREEDVDAKIRAATALEEDSEGRENNRNDDLADIASGESHRDGLLWWFALGWVLCGLLVACCWQ